MFNAALREVTDAFNKTLGQFQAGFSVLESGLVSHVGHGVALVTGLPGVQALELVEFADGSQGMAFNLDPDDIGVVLLSADNHITAGSAVRRTGRVADVPVGSSLLGRVVNALGQPLDEQKPISLHQRWPIERDAPAILERAPVTEPLHTGIKVIDAAIPIGRGQRQLIIGDRQTGKTAIALATLANQRNSDMVCVYCAIGQRGDAVARAIESLQTQGIMSQTIVVVAAAQDPPGLQYITPYAATSIAEYFMQQEGRDVVIVYDDLSQHALAYRELSLLLRRPPGREAYPGDIFYIHSRLLERATRLAQGGSLTALPIIQIEAENLAAYIATNLISITDGQIYLSPELFHRGLLPAVDVGKSVSRVGGKAQLPAYRLVAGALKLYYAQFEELEMFARFGTRLDDKTRAILERGRRVREILKQQLHETLNPCAQIALLLAVTEGLFDRIALDKVRQAELSVRDAVDKHLSALERRIENGEALNDEDRALLLSVARNALPDGASDGNRTNP